MKAILCLLLVLIVTQHGHSQKDPWPCFINSAEGIGLRPSVEGIISGKHGLHWTNKTNGNVIDIAKGLGLTELLRLIDNAQLTDTLKSGIYTLIGASDEAFGSLPDWYQSALQSNITLLKDLVRYHVIPGTLYTSSMHDGVMSISLLKGASVRFNRFINDKLITITGAPISAGDNNATNGVVHVVQKVMWPIPTDEMVNVSAKCNQFSTLLKAARVCGIANTTMRGFPLTMFAPTNSAFDKLPPGTLDALLKNTTELKFILSNHFVAGNFYTAGLQDGNRIHTIGGGFLNISLDGDIVTVNNATITFSDISVINGVMHAIDTVMFLPSIV